MTEKLKHVLRSVAYFDDESLGRVVDHFSEKRIKKGTVLLKEGSVCKEFYFIDNGCIRTYFITWQGDEKTRYVMPDAHIGTALASFVSQTPSFEAIDALEDSALLVINHSEFYELTESVPQFKNFYTRMLEMAYTFQNNRIENLMTLPAKERYEKLLNENPALIQRLSNKILASYLDIRQETLSRLKSKQRF